MSKNYLKKKKNNYLKIFNTSYDTEFLASSVFVYYNINGKQKIML